MFSIEYKTGKSQLQNEKDVINGQITKFSKCQRLYANYIRQTTPKLIVTGNNFFLYSVCLFYGTLLHRTINNILWMI